MSSYRLATRYAKSLVGLAQEKGVLDQAFTDLKLVDVAIQSSRDLKVFFKSPVIDADKKLRVVELLFKGKVGEMVYGFMALLIKKGREGYLHEIAHSFIDQYNVIKAITPVKLTSAVKLDDTRVQELIGALKTKEGLTTLQLTEAVDETLIGGFVLEYSGKMLDTSIKRKLYELKGVVDDDSYVKKYS